MSALLEGPHSGYILAAYLLAAAVILGLILVSVIDARIQHKALEKLESQGLGRRSARKNENN
jgi:heme exporter protein CcmD